MRPYISGGNVSTAIDAYPAPYKDDTSFRMTFHDGYTIRNLFELFKKCNLKTNIRLSKNEIHFSEGNENGNILNEFTIDTSNLIEYEFNSSYDIYLLSFDPVKFCDRLKSVGTKQTLRLFKRAEVDLICLQIVSSYDQNPKSGSMMKPLIHTGKIINRLPPPFTITISNIFFSVIGGVIIYLWKSTNIESLSLLYALLIIGCAYITFLIVSYVLVKAVFNRYVHFLHLRSFVHHQAYEQIS